MSAPTPTTVTTPTTAKPPCILTKEGVLEHLRSLRPQDGGVYADAVIELARAVRTRQIEIAAAEWEQCRLWKGEHGQWGIYNKDGQLRRVQRSYSKTHWHVVMAFMPAISALNAALSDIAFRYPHRAEQVRLVRPNPKHYYILRWLGATETTDEKSRSADTLTAH